MKQLNYFLLSIILLIGCNNPNQERTVKSKDIIQLSISKELIDLTYHIDNIQKEYPGTNLIETATYLFDLNKNNNKDTIVLLRVDTFEGDPGDFHQILIKMADGYIFELNNINGWVRFDHNYTVPNSVKKLNQLESDLLVISEFNNSKSIYLFGWVYASYPGLFSMIEFSNGFPQLVFSQNRELYSISNDSIHFQDEIKKSWIGIQDKRIKEFIQ